MAFRATLNIGGKEFDVIRCDYELNRDVDPKGRPASNIYGGKVNVVVESTGDTSILDSMVNQFQPSTGSIIYKKGDEEAKMKELTWENGRIVAFKETLDTVGTHPMLIAFSVSAQILKVGDVQFEQNWPQN